MSRRQGGVEHGPVYAQPQPSRITQASYGMSHKGELHLKGIHPFVSREAPQPLEAVKQVVLWSWNPAFFGSGIASSQLGEAESLLFEDGAHKEGEVGLLGNHKKRCCDVDRGFSAAVPWQWVKPPSGDGDLATPSYPGRFRSFNCCGGYASEGILRESLFGEQRGAEAVIGCHEGAPAGFALFFHNFSTFLGRPGIYLEDLYVTPKFR